MDAAAMKHMTSNFAKLDKFEGVDFIRWQKKMHFLLSTMSVVYVLTTHIPEDGGDDATVKQIRKRNKWDNDDYVCRELWNSLEAKYMAEDASSKKFLVSNFTNYKITISRPVMEQYNELLDFKHTLKNKKEELTLVELGSHLRIEESLRAHDSDKPKGNNVAGPQLNIVSDNIGSAFMSTSEQHDSILWHARLGHSVGIIYETTAPYTPQQNGVSERKNRVLKEMVDSMLSYSGLSQVFWGEAMTVVRLPDRKLKTLGERGIECIFVGYAEHSKAFRIPNGTEDIGGSVVPEEVTKEVLADLPPGCKPLGCKWIFKRKLKLEWKLIEKFKARLVIQGFKQKSGIDYFDTYAPVARISTIRLLIAMASIHSLIIHQMDMKTTFLNGELDEEAYMNQP
ncbi:zinc finger, CCHC-type containing protein [Tanacetum coccineum]|uniref:Zinc finger, CCHC-type containing protein n=1 Tax=Tanacetum coccineum TaxID=301880 RepID=A0ABQ5B9S5_9ASTR